jgi:hypothetical protein
MVSAELSGVAISAQEANGGYARTDCAGPGFDGAGKILTRAPAWAKPHDHPDLSNPDEVWTTATRSAHHITTVRANWRNAMRSVLALGFLIALCASANAAARGHHAEPRHVVARHSQATAPSFVTPSGARIFRDDSVPGGLRTDHDDPPSYDDPSKYGGA